ncbi:MAG TPA: hypothetical protein DCZ95_00395 [Verrucomicrobia bacterium]|nr:MAG: hypothetical protein A2X46_03530 [Lentisphaerae bacterium GWF2_57_35]HBA82528.1 hypothetical protein [Verrucomicrobiota bacterium]
MVTHSPLSKIEIKRVLGFMAVLLSLEASSLARTFESFENASFPPPGWTKTNLLGGSGWYRLTAGTAPLPGWGNGTSSVPPTAGAGSHNAYCSWNTGGGASEGYHNNQWLISPKLYGLTATSTISLWIRASFTNYPDSVIFRVSSSGKAPGDFTYVVQSNYYRRGFHTTQFSPWSNVVLNVGSLGIPAGTPIYLAVQEWCWDNTWDGAAIELDVISSDLTPPPEPKFSPTQVVFSCDYQTDPSAQVFNIVNAGSGDFNLNSNVVTYGSGASGWISSMTPQASWVDAGGAQAITATVVAADLDPGTYYATNSFSAPGGTNNPIKLPIVLNVRRWGQTISFPAISPKPMTSRVGLSAEASSDMLVSFGMVSGPGQIRQGTNLTFTSTGTVKVAATQFGDFYWLPATVTNSITVLKGIPTIIFSNVLHTYDGAQKPATASTSPTGLPVTITYNGSVTPPVNAGTYSISGRVSTALYESSQLGTQIIAKADQAIGYALLGNQVSTARVGLTATAASGLTVGFSVASGPASITGGTNLSFTGAGDVTLLVSQPGNGNWNAAPSLTNTLAVSKAVAPVTLGSLLQPYNGTSRAATATTVPPGLNVEFTYDGSNTPPVNVGSYSVTGTINEAMYQGSQTGTLVVVKADQTIAFPDPGSQVTTNKLVLSATASSGLPVAFAASGPALLAGGTNLSFTGEGFVSVVAAQSGNTNWLAAPDVTNRFWVSKTLAGVELSNFTQTYDGTAKAITVTTTPMGLTVVVDYDGVSTLPVNAGSYAVTAMVNDVIYCGGRTGVFTLARATQTLSFASLGMQYRTNQIGLAATASSGLGTAFSIGEGPALIADGTNLSFTGLGNVTLLVNQTGNTNWNAAPTLTNAFQVVKALASVTLSDLAYTYDGTPKNASATTVPVGLTVDFTYDGHSEPPLNSGSYSVTGTVNDAIYQGAQTGTFVIGRADQTISYVQLEDQLSTNTIGLAASASSGLAVVFATNDGPAVIAGGTNLSFIGSGSVTLFIAQPGDTNWTAAPTLTNTFSVSKAVAPVTLGSLLQPYNGTSRVATATTVPPGLNVEFTYDGYEEPPLNSGSYSVTGTINEAMYQGSQTGTLVVIKAGQIITFPDPGSQLTTNKLGLSATAGSGLPVTFAASGPALLTGGTNLSFTGEGFVSVVAAQSGNTNWLVAPDVTNRFWVSKTLAGVELSNLTQTYDGTAKAITVTTTPTGLTVAVDYDGSSTLPVNAGSYAVTAIVNDVIYCGGRTGVLTLARATQTLAFASLGMQPRTNQIGLAATAFSGLGVEFSIGEGPALIADGTNLSFTGLGNVTLLVSQAGNTNWNAAPTLTNTFEVVKAVASVVLSDLAQTYDGTPKSASATTVPVGLTVDFTYDGRSEPPLNSGSYSVTGTVNDAVFQGAQTGTLVIGRADQTIAYLPLGAQVSTNTIGLAASASSGLTVLFTTNDGPAVITGGTNLSFIGAGSVTLLVSQSGDTNWTAAPTLTNTFSVSKAVAPVSLNNLAQTYDGTPRIVTATTVPAGLTVDFTYDGSSEPPLNSGSYSVTGTINEAMYQGSQTGTLVVIKAGQAITFPDPGSQVTTNKVGLTATASSGLPVAFAASGPALLTGGTNLSFTGEGFVSVVAAQLGNTNWLAAPDVTNRFWVSKTLAGVELSDLTQTYDGTAKAIAVTTTPTGLTVAVDYDGGSTLPVNAGSYAVTAMVNDVIYCGGRTGVLTLARATQTLAFASLGMQSRTNQIGLAAVSSSGLGVEFSIGEGPALIADGTNLSFTGLGNVTLLVSQAGNTNWNAAPTLTNAFEVVKAVASVVLSDLAQTYDGTPKSATAATVPAGLTVNLTYDGHSEPPLNSGSYSVTGTVSDAIYQGVQTGTLTIVRAEQAIAFTPLAGQLTTNKLGLGATASSGLTVLFSTHEGPALIVNGTNLTFTGAGSVTLLVSQAGNTNWNAAPSITNTFAVTKASAAVSFTNLLQVYDGSPKQAMASTTPAGLTVDISYPSVDAGFPVNAGSYPVLGLVSDVMYQGSGSNVLTIVKANQTIGFSNPGAQLITNAPNLAATGGGSGNPVLFNVRSGPADLHTSTNASWLTFTATGQVVVAASQAGNANYEGAPSVTNTFMVSAVRPDVEQPFAQNIGASTAALGAQIVDVHGALVSERGVYWSLTNGFTAASGNIASETGSFDIGMYTQQVSGLPPNSILYFRGFAVNDAGTNYTAQSQFLTCPAAPTALAATGIADAAFFANWGLTAGATNYLLDVGIDSNFAGYVSGYQNLGAGNEPTCLVTGLTAGVAYYYRVRGENATGAGPNSGTVRCMTLPPAPVSEAASDILPNRFTANWQPALSATHYFLEVSENLLFTNFVAGYEHLAVGDAASFGVTGLSVGTLYCYRVQAQNESGVSSNSAVVEVTTCPLLTLLCWPHEAGSTVPQTGSYPVAFSVPTQIVAQANAGYVFSYWSSTGGVWLADSLSRTTTATLVSNSIVTACFTENTLGKSDVAFTNWTINWVQGCLVGSALICNQASNGSRLAGPFWYCVQTNREFRLLHPQGIDPVSGYPYVDVTTQMEAALVDKVLDPGDCALVTNVLFYSRYLRNPSNLVWVLRAVVLPATERVDTDGDVMPDVWEQVYSPALNSLDPLDGALDPDADEMMNRQEWICGTDPTDGASYLAVRSMAQPSASLLALQWPASSGRVYYVSSGTNILMPFAVIGAHHADHSSMNVFTTQVDAAQGGRFYKLEVEYPQP